MLLGGDYTVHNNSAIHAASAASRSRPACHHALAASASAAESAAFASRCVAASVAQSRAAADAAQRVRGIGVRGRGGRAGVQQRCASASAGRAGGTWSELYSLSPPPQVSNSRALSNYKVSNQPSFLAVWAPLARCSAESGAPGRARAAIHCGSGWL